MSPLPVPAAVSLHVWRVPGRSVPRALYRMAVDRRRLRALPGVRFAKLVGTGTGDGFGPGDADLTRYAALIVWDDPDGPARFDETAPGRAWRALAAGGVSYGEAEQGGASPRKPRRGVAHREAEQSVRVDLRPLASRGRWSGQEPFGAPDGKRTRGVAREGAGVPARVGQGNGESTGGGPGQGSGERAIEGPGRHATEEPRQRAIEKPEQHATGAPGPRAGEGSGLDGRPVLVLTRARLRVGRALMFWRAVPAVVRELHAAPGLLARFGVGEAPVGWQGTISVWRSATDLVRFAYRQPGHRAVIARTATAGWYAEELFARFAVLAVHGNRAVLGWSEEAGSESTDGAGNGGSTANTNTNTGNNANTGNDASAGHTDSGGNHAGAGNDASASNTASAGQDDGSAGQDDGSGSGSSSEEGRRG